MACRGFKFGMLLQLAVGPMCLLVFNTAADEGLAAGITLMSSIAAVDLLFITLAGLGAGALLKREKARRAVKIFGAMVLVLFGADLAAGAFGVQLLPEVRLFSAAGGGLFATGLLLTASNPLTIVFWSGVFSAQITERHYDRKQLRLFGLGCVLSTIIFLSFVAVLGATAGKFLPSAVIRTLNVCVGCLIVFFGLRLLLRKETK